MKNRSRLIIAIFALLTFSGIASAQNNEDIEKQLDGKIDVSQAARSQMQISALKEKPVKCPLGLQQIISAGIYDNIALPTEATFKSPALLSVFPSPPYNYKDFDDPAVNKMVGQSFMLKNYKPCEGRMCSALLEVQVCNQGKDLWTNDKIYVGFIDGNKLNSSIAYGDIWKPSEKNTCKNLSYPISPGVLASLSSLEILIQDDTIVDNMKLTLNY